MEQQETETSRPKRLLSPGDTEGRANKTTRLNEERTDDIQNPNHNPSTTDVIPDQQVETDEVMMTETTFPDIDKMNEEQLLTNYKVNQSKLIKVDHHLKFLRQSLQENKIPKGLQINKTYQVMEETEDFKAEIRSIHMLAEMDIVNQIIEHYDTIYRQLCQKSACYIKALEKQPSPTISNKVQQIDKPITDMKEKLSQKRNNKLTKLDTHIQRGDRYIKKEKPTKQRLNYQRRNTDQPRPDPPRQTQRPRPPYHQQREQRPTYAAVTDPNRQQRNNPPRQRTGDLNTTLDVNTITELVTRTVQQMITRMSPFYHQPDYQTMNYHY